ncbi:uncharacterized protein FOKN1_1355 [Thiohalobacter thiocyanaticus]|uniref:Zorya protein ZorC EH domain-containing protein n=1 Tax=Thiohalobacter thiocyanaticus TaxID=585455 RepID=A0A1Z4VQJ0_9GAMM|nr:EH signature domain-containing protein [Thiohalobacter thiocyanaticus]BAZ93753.1 uncharacterized protein FOKN1_1355 [Thiohalobacter thiocyanaticus]
MAGLKESLSSRVVTSPHSESWPAPALETAIREARWKLARVEPRDPPQWELDAVRTRLRALLPSPKKLYDAPRSLIRRGAWLLFEPGSADGETAFASERRFIETYFRRVYGDRMQGTVIAIIRAFLAAYPAQEDYFNPVRKALGQMVSDIDGVRLRVVKEQVDKFGLLEENAPTVLAEQLAQAEREPEQVLEQAGLTGDCAVRGLIEYAYAALLDHIGQWLKDSDNAEALLQRLFRFSIVRQPAGAAFRFPRYRNQLIESVLMPFSERDPSDSEQRVIRDFLLEHVGDPRTHRGEWYGVSDAARAVMMQWLVEETMEDFFRLLNALSDTDREVDRHWRYRRAFWMAYLRHGYIRDAWIALASGAERLARQRFKATKDGYGTVSGNGTKANHAVLLMRIDDLVITEWNHTGKYRVWQMDDRHCPRLYQRSYSRQELMNQPRHDGAHMGAENGTWQSNLAGYVRRKTGASVSAREYLRG